MAQTGVVGGVASTRETRSVGSNRPEKVNIAQNQLQLVCCLWLTFLERLRSINQRGIGCFCCYSVASLSQLEQGGYTSFSFTLSRLSRNWEARRESPI